MSSDDDESKVNVIPMDSFASDGDMNTWPGHPYAERNDQKWRELLATNWLAKMGSLEAGELGDRSCTFLFFIYRAFIFLLCHNGLFALGPRYCFLRYPILRAKGTRD